MPVPNPYHEGELRIQQLDGVLQQAQGSGRVISDTIIRGALKFIAQQPMAVLGSVDDDQTRAHFHRQFHRLGEPLLDLAVHDQPVDDHLD